MHVRAGSPSDHRTRFEADAIPYMRHMYPAALRLTGHRCDAEDLIQETFARAYEKFGQFAAGTNLRAWLYRIMSRVFLSKCRTRSRRPGEVLAANVHEAVRGHARLVSASRSAEERALESVSESTVMRALGELPPQFKTVIYLADIEGYPYADIAALTGAPLGSVRSRVHRGRQMLRTKLGDQSDPRGLPVPQLSPGC